MRSPTTILKHSGLPDTKEVRAIAFEVLRIARKDAEDDVGKVHRHIGSLLDELVDERDEVERLKTRIRKAEEALKGDDVDPKKRIAAARKALKGTVIEGLA